MVGNWFECERIPDEDHPSENGPFYFVKSTKSSKVKMKADALMIKNNIKPGLFQQIRNDVITYIPAALVPYVQIDQERWSAELRRLTIMFVNL